MRHINHIIVHCAATPAGKHFTVSDINEWHKARGWRDPITGIPCGYHWVIYLDGSIHKGRPESSVGAHVAGHNKNSIGICYIGGVDKLGKAADTRTPAQKAALEKLIREICHRHPIKNVSGHNQFANKACPSFDASTVYDKLIVSDLPKEEREKLIPDNDNLIEPGERDEDGDTRIADWQQKLRAYGYDVPITGEHTGVSVDATRWFQKATGILVDGIVGDQTEKAMDLSIGIRTAPRDDGEKPPVGKPLPKDGTGAATGATALTGVGLGLWGLTSGQWAFAVIGVIAIALAVGVVIYRKRKNAGR